MCCARYPDPETMDDTSLNQDLLKALRSAPGRSLDELAGVVGLPTTNFGRPLGHRLRGPVSRLVDEGLVEERDGRYRLSESGRRTLAEWAFDPPR